MFDQDRLADIISAYKEYFPVHFKDEQYKWVAIKHFQDNWDIDAEDFFAMFETATSKTYNLLANMNNYPRGMMLEFIKADSEAVRSMFRGLYDESQDLTIRIDQFIDQANAIRDKYDTGSWKNHYQGANAISIYLWLRFPDKYYIYKYSEVREIAKETLSDYVPRKGNPSYNVVKSYHFYDEIKNIVQKDKELDELFTDGLTSQCYPDKQKNSMVVDIGFFTSRFYVPEKKKAEEWEPKDYDPEISVSEWVKLLNDKEIFTESSLKIMRRMLDIGGMATCKELSVKYGKTPNFYNSGSSSLAKRIYQKVNCQLPEETENSKYWPILYLGRYAAKDSDGIYIWKLRDSLREALEKTDLSSISLYEYDLEDGYERNYWWLNANPSVWSFNQIALEEEQDYTLYNEKGNKRRIFQNFLEAKAGDLVIGYESTPVKQIVAIARISKENDGERIFFQKIKSLEIPVSLSEIKDLKELEKMEYFVNSQGSLFKLTREEYATLLSIIKDKQRTGEVDPPEEEPTDDTVKNDSYSKEDFLSQVYMGEEKYDILLELLKNKKNLILQGAPGVGKTYAAERLAYSIMGEIDKSRVEFIQFHQNYSYEDFIMGYKPNDDGFKLEEGIFYEFCLKAKRDPKRDYFFIIDEINRGNMSKIFGELLMLIEKDYRGKEAKLAYNKRPFSVPENLYIIGMMNTADRSLAMIDYALRRRFCFFEMEPGFLSDGFMRYQKGLNNETFDSLIDNIINLNMEIYKDDSLGSGFRIGHSYFCGKEECTEEWMKSVIYYDIIPTLQEYWFDDKQKVQKWESILSGIFDD